MPRGMMPATFPGRRAVLSAVGVALLGPRGGTRAQGGFPNRPIRVIVPFAPGGASDVSARLVGTHLSARLGQPVVVVNKAGAATVIGAEEAARSAPDGYTLLLAPPPFVITQYAYSNLPYNPERDFRPVALLVVSQNAVLVRANLPARSLAEFIALAKARPGALSYASPGNGSLPHVAFELLKLRADIDVMHVPYRGGGPAIADVAGGRVDAMIASPLEAAGQVQGGRIRPLAVAGGARIPSWPEVPTAAEAGLPGFSAPGWFGLVAPAGVPDAIVARLNAEIRTVLALEEVRVRLGELGAGQPGGFRPAARGAADAMGRGGGRRSGESGVRATPRPNILWLCSDQQRWDTIGRLGNPHVHTPTLDALAAGGTAFRRAYTQSPICTPSRASMLTGRYPASHGVYRNGNVAFPAHETLVTRMLADAGYDCGLVGKLHLSAAKFYEQRPDDGYRVFHWNHHPTPDAARGDAYEHWLRHKKQVDPQELYRGLGAFCGPGVPAALHQTTWCAEMATRFIEDRRDSPWLLSVNFFDPHAPFDAAPEYLAQVDPASLPLPLWRDSDAERWRDFERVDQQQTKPQDPRIRHPGQPPATAHREHDLVASHVPEGYDALAVKANYYAMIQHIDAQVGRILEALRRTGQEEDTIVLYHSDHGELLGDHGLVLKGCRFFDGLVRVPLIWRWPGRVRAALESDALVELVDIAPTLLEAAGIEQPWQMQGQSLLPILEGRACPDRHKPHVVSEFRDSIGGHADHSHGSMVFDGHWKSVVYHGHPVDEIFDHDSDPGEFDNLWSDIAIRAERLKAHLDALAGTVSGGPPRSANY